MIQNSAKEYLQNQSHFMSSDHSREEPKVSLCCVEVQKCHKESKCKKGCV